MKIAVIDNYDSFTYNLVQILREYKAYQVDVFRNDQYQLSQLESYEVLVLSLGQVYLTGR